MIHLGTGQWPEPPRFNPTAALVAVVGQLLLGGFLVAMAPSAPELKPAAPPSLQVVFVAPALFSGSSALTEAPPPAAGSAAPPGEATAPQEPSVPPPREEPAKGERPHSVQVASSRVVESAEESPKAAASTPAPAPVAPKAVQLEPAPRAVAVQPVAPAVVSTPAPAPAVVKEEPRAPAKPAGETRGPVIVKRAVPQYPSIARSQRITGTVSVEVTIGADGSIEEANITQSPSPLLNSAALDAARLMKFEPALIDGVPARGKLTVLFSFKL